MGVLGQRAATLGTNEGDQLIKSRCYLMTARGDRIPINRKEFSIGRSAPNDETWAPDLDVRTMELEHSKTVSRFHCRILLNDNDTCDLMDMGSFNGTWLNSKQLEPRIARPLNDNDEINLGGVRFIYHIAPADQHHT